MDLAGIRLRGVSKTFLFDCTGLSLERGDYAVVPTERGAVLGEVVHRIGGADPAPGKTPCPKVVRAATADDLRAHQENARRESEGHALCLARIAARQMAMKLVRTEVLLDRSKSIFYFTADGRVDFRELVKDLAHELRTRIEMRQIGVRDEARAVGGFGPCGREMCCASFLADFEPITVRMAKDQKLALNPAKLSGVCGRLMCCLIYEHESYGKNQACGPCEGRKGGPGRRNGPAEGRRPARPEEAPEESAPEGSEEDLAARMADDGEEEGRG